VASSNIIRSVEFLIQGIFSVKTRELFCVGNSRTGICSASCRRSVSVIVLRQGASRRLIAGKQQKPVLITSTQSTGNLECFLRFWRRGARNKRATGQNLGVAIIDCLQRTKLRWLWRHLRWNSQSDARAWERREMPAGLCWEHWKSRNRYDNA
jgi:hypothetical protein